MEKKSFAASGHLPTLVAAFLYFDVSFMVWVLFGPMTPFIADQMHLSATQKGLLTAIPLLGGSFFRPILGLLAGPNWWPARRPHWPHPDAGSACDWLALCNECSGSSI